MLAPFALAALLHAPAASAEPDGPVHARVNAGIGMPELLHVDVGWFPASRVVLDLHYGNVLFNHEVGVAGTAYLLGVAGDHRPPRHALLLRGEIDVNPTVSPPTLKSGGETIAAYMAAYAGYGLTASCGFQVQVLAGGLLDWESGPAGGPNATIGVGWAF